MVERKLGRRQFLGELLVLGGLAVADAACGKPTPTIVPSPTLAPTTEVVAATAFPTATLKKKETSVPEKTSLPTTSPEPERAKAIYDEIYRMALRNRQKRAEKDPTYLERVDWELNLNRVNVLVLGLDMRPEEAIGRADAIMCLSLDIVTNGLVAFSVPRDLHSPRTDALAAKAGYADQPFRVNATTVFGGPEDMRVVLEDMTGLSQDLCFVWDFQGAQDIIDALGGVDINIDQEFIDAYLEDFQYYKDSVNSALNIPHVGLNHFNGLTAFWYARVRYQDTCFDRDSRQREVAMAAIKTLRGRLSGNPFLLLPLAATVTKLTDEGRLRTIGEFGLSDILAVIGQAIKNPNQLRDFPLPEMLSTDIWSGLVDSGRLPEPEQWQIFLNNRETADPPDSQESYTGYWEEVRQRINHLLKAC